MYIAHARLSTTLMVAKNEMPQLMSQAPILVKPVAFGWHRDHWLTTQCEAVCRRKVHQTNSVDTKAKFETFDERPNKIVAKDFPDFSR
ncbi:hypothetical protein E3G40_002687 [Mycobacteroides abscessus]|nr:hypothetical protein [Mycobacteroides abscessus]